MKPSLLRAKFGFSIALVVWLTLLCNALSAQFIDHSDMLGAPIINPGSPHGDGISFYDFNYDGWDDLTISNGPSDPLFFVNNNGVLEPAEFSIANTPSENISMIMWADYDNDGDADLLITKFGAPLQLWRNDGDFDFTEVSQTAGLLNGHYNHVGAAWADYNHDGCLDLYIAKFYHPDFFPGEVFTNRLYLNNCDGTFTDVTQSSGIYLPARPCFQPVFLDYNHDGWEDLLLVIDRIFWPNELFRNNGDGTFTRITESAGWDFNFDAMTGTVGDFDNDADLDVYLTNNPYYTFGTVLMENNDDETFTNTATQHGVSINQVTWGSLWLDFDNDSWQDLFVSVTSPVLEPIGNQFFVSNAGTGFTSQNQYLGIAGDTSEAFVCAMGDLNNDGYYDFALNNKYPDPAKLYFNDGGVHNYLSVSVEGTLSNPDGIGTWIRCFAGGNEYVRYTLSGENLIGQNSRKMIFGLGTMESVDSLILEWNMGTVETYYNVPINSHQHYIEGMSMSMPFAIQPLGNWWLCPEDSVVLDGGSYETHLWNNGWEERFLTVTEPGNYQVSVTNGFGITIESLPIAVESAPEPTIDWAIDHVSCFGAMDGSILVEVSTGPLDSVLWDSGAQIPFIENLGPDTYHFSAIDSYGCVVSDSAVVDEPDALLATAQVNDALCYGENSGSASIAMSGGTPPHIPHWGELNGQALSAGNYTISYSDWNGCTDSVSFTVDQPDSLYLDLEVTDQLDEMGGSASVEIYGGSPPYEIYWSTGNENSETLENLDAGEYSLLVSDANGCDLNSEFTINLISGLDAHKREGLVLYPNPCGNQLFLQNCKAEVLNIDVLDLSGKTIMTLVDHPCFEPVNTSILRAGSYFMKITSNGQPDSILLFTKTND